MRSFHQTTASNGDSLEHLQGMNRDGRVELHAISTPCYPRLLAKPGPGERPACQQRRLRCLAGAPAFHCGSRAQCTCVPPRTWRSSSGQSRGSGSL